MAITDLTNTTWMINDSPNWGPLSGSSASYSLNFTTIDVSYESISFARAGSTDKVSTIDYDEGNVFYDSEGGWAIYTSAFRKIHITGGVSATNSTLIAWLMANATQVGEVTISYNNSTIVALNDSCTTTLQTDGNLMADDITVEYQRPPAPQPNLQIVTNVSPTTIPQTITPSAGYDGIAMVDINAISPTKGAQTYTPTTTDQVISSGRWLTGNQTIKGDANLVAANIASGVTIFGVQGTHTGGGTDNMPAFISRTYSYDTTSVNVLDYSIIGSGAYAWMTQAVSLSFPNCTTLGSGAFFRANFSHLAFPSCTDIGYYAFSYYPNTDFAFPAITTVPSYAFYSFSGTQISKAVFPNATKVGGSAFRYAATPTVINWDGLTSAEGYAFANCTGLTTVNLPSLTGTAASYIFYQDSKITSVSLPNLAACSVGTFYQCYSLTSIYLPKVSYVSNTTFAYCSYMTAAYFTSLSKISSTYAFRNCLRLVSLYLLSTTMVTLTSRTTAFTSTPLSNYSTSAGQWGSIYVRASLLDTYKSNTNWAYFSARLVGLTDAEIAALPIYS